MTGLPDDFDWDELLRAATALQEMLPDAVLLGGSAAAPNLGHRSSRDADFALGDLQTRFDELLTRLGAREDWASPEDHSTR